MSNVNYFWDQIENFVDSASKAYDEAKLLAALYSNQVASLLPAGATDPATTVQSSLTRTDLTDANFMVLNFINFFENQAVTQSNYQGIIDRIKNGTTLTPLSTPLGQSVENYALRLKVWVQNVQKAEVAARKIKDTYFDVALNVCVDAVAAIPTVGPGMIVFGTKSSAGSLQTGINFVTNYENMINNSAITQADWGAVLSNWITRDLRH